MGCGAGVACGCTDGYPCIKPIPEPQNQMPPCRAYREQPLTHDAHNAAVAYKEALQFLENHCEMPSKLKTFITRYMQTVVFNE
jgi:hypothetical protein